MATIIDKVMIALGIDASGMQTGADESGKQIDRVEKKVDEAKEKLKGIGQSVDDFGKKAGEVLLQFVAPVLAAVSVGKMIGGYFSDVAAVAEATGAYNKTLEETRLKKAQLQRISKDDIEFYKKSREALVKFNIAFGDFGAAIMRSLIPGMEKALGWLGKVSDWLSRNPDNILRFLKVLGAVVGTVLIPVFVRWAAVLLANPITWIVGMVLALALAIDDLIVYLKGGRSSLDSLWKAMGFVKGDTAALAKMIAWLKDTGLSLAKALGVLLAAFTAFKAVTGIINGIRTAWTALSASFLANPVVLAFGLVATAAYMLYKRWDDVCEGAKALAEDIADFFADWGRGIADGFSALADDISSAWDSVTDFFAGLIGNAVGALSGFVSACSDAAASAGDAIGTGFGRAKDFVSDTWQGIKDGARALTEDIASAFGGVWQGIKDGASALAEDAGSAFGAMGAAVAPALSWISGKASGVWQSVSDGAVSAGNAMLSAFDSAKSGIGGAWQGIKDGASALVDGIENAFSGLTEWLSSLWDRIAGGFTSALNAVSGVWQGLKDGASALVDDIENVFSGLTGWFSSLWDKITGVFDRAIGSIKSGIMSVTDALGITDSKREEREELAERTPADPEFERQKQAIIARRKKREQTQAVQADNVPAVRTEKAAAGKPESREPAQPVQTGVSAPAVKTEKITEKRTEVRERIVPLVLRAHQAGQQVQQILAGAGRAQTVKAAPVNTSNVSSFRNSTVSNTRNDNRRQEVNITINGNADRGTAQQIGNTVTGVFKDGAMSPVQ